MNNTGGRVRQVSQRVLPLLKKCWWLVFVVLIIIGVNFSHKFLAVATDSMDPVIVRGDLVLIHNIAPGDVKVGDVIVYHVRPVLQDKYGYPSSICHRVISVSKTVDGLSFRTKGDANDGEDPFIIQPSDLIGQQSGLIHYLGFPIMFFHTKQGLLCLFGLGLLYLFYGHSSQIMSGAKKARGAVFGMSNAEMASSQRQFEKNMETMTQQITGSMNSFSSAMAEYAQHLASHTGAVKSLASAANHLENVVANGGTIPQTQPVPFQLNEPPVATVIDSNLLSDKSSAKRAQKIVVANPANARKLLVERKTKRSKTTETIQKQAFPSAADTRRQNKIVAATPGNARNLYVERKEKRHRAIEALQRHSHEMLIRPHIVAATPANARHLLRERMEKRRLVMAAMQQHTHTVK